MAKKAGSGTTWYGCVSHGGCISHGSSSSSDHENANPITGVRAVVGARALLQTACSFNSYGVLVEAMAEEERHALETPWHCKRLVETMAHYEKDLAACVLREGSVFRLSADGLEMTYHVEIGTVRSWHSCQLTARRPDGWRSWALTDHGSWSGSLEWRSSLRK